jgi:surfeit locus 1 family protein
MVFRPLPVLTLVSLPALALLLYLGSWQLDRRAWKTELLAQYAAIADAPAMDWQAAICGSEPHGRAVSLSSPQGHAGEIRVYGRSPDGAPGWRIFQAVQAPDCIRASTVLVETGFITLIDAVESPVTAWRLALPQRAGLATPAPSIEAREFYAFDADAIAETLGLMPEEIYAGAWIGRDDGEAPPALTQTPPERHLGYAVTWFAMAVAFIGVYLAYHAQSGRLRFRR